MFAVPENTLARAADPARGHPVRLAMRVAAERHRWQRLLRYDPDERYAALITADSAQEVWLLSWLPGQYAPPHDHGDATGAFTVVHGVLSESVARRGGPGAAPWSPHTLEPGQSRVFGPGYVHEVGNAGADPAVSVHVYRAPGRTIRPYELDPVDGPVRCDAADLAGVAP